MTRQVKVSGMNSIKWEERSTIYLRGDYYTIVNAVYNSNGFWMLTISGV